MPVRLVVREAVAAARGHLVPSLLTLLVVAAMTLATVATAGRAVAAERAVLGVIDDEGTRSIVVRARAGSDVMTSDLVTGLAAVHQVESVVGFTDPVMVDPEGVPRSTQWGMRTMVAAGQTEASHYLPGAVLATQGALDALGFADAHGVVVTATGEQVTVAGPITLPASASILGPVIVRPVALPGGVDGVSAGSPAAATAPDAVQPIALTTVIVVVDSPADVALVSKTLTDLLATPNPQDVTVQTSQSLVDVRAAVAGTLTSYSRSNAVGILSGAAVLVMATLMVVVALRRRDYGRRRALGATRGLLMLLLEVQTVMLAVVGSTLGAGVALVILAVQGAPLPGADYVGAIALLAVLAAILGALPPAVYAATRDPLTELRQP